MSDSPIRPSHTVTSDGFVLAQRQGVGANEMLGTEARLNRNLLTFIEAAWLTDEEVSCGRLLTRARQALPPQGLMRRLAPLRYPRLWGSRAVTADR